MSEVHHCPTCGQVVPERYEGPQLGTSVTADDALRTGTMGPLRNKLAELHEKYPHGRPGSRNWWRHRSGHEEGCVLCGGELPANVARGRTRNAWKAVSSNRMFCSSSCRQRAYRIKKKLESVGAPESPEDASP